MGAGEALLHRLLDAGFDLRVDLDGGLRIAPAAAITDELRGEIRRHRGDLIVLIHDPADDRRQCTDCAAFDGQYCARPALSGLEEPGVISRMLQRCPGFAQTP